MNRWHKLFLAFCVALASTGIQAQIAGNLLMPPPVDMTKSSWDVTLQQGNLTFGLPIASVPGEVPIQVAFGMNATYTATTRTHWVWDPEWNERVAVVNEFDRPMVGGIHFGYISDPATYSGTLVEGLSVLEGGNQVADSQWTTFSSHTNLGSALNLPQAYGFLAVGISAAKVDPTATYLSFTTTAAGLGTTYQSVVQGLAPSGFGAGSTSYKVIMDKNKARIYAYATSVHSWVPVVWADRFGHYVTFQWVRSTTGIPPGITAITKVTATNLRGKGVVLRWADYVSNVNDVVLLRLDFVNIHAPSVVIKGYPSYTGAPTAFGYPFSPDNQWTVVPSIIGSTCRPTTIQVGAFGTLSQPSWSDYGSTADAAPGAPPVDGTSDSAMRQWTFVYDTAKAELVSLTQPNGLTNSFIYTNYPVMDGGAGKIATRGVSEVHLAGMNGSVKQNMRWTRTYPSGTTPMSVKLEGWWDPDKAANPDRYHQVVFLTDALNFGNGVYQVDTLKDASGKAWRTTTYSYNTTGAGLNSGLSSVQSMTVQQDGVPTITTAFGYPDSSNLQVTRQDVSVTDTGGIARPVSATTSIYGSRWDMLEGHQLTQTVTTRYKPNGTTLPSVTQKNVYDTPASGYPLLQLQKSYLDGGTVGQHGTTYTYDSQGRFSSQIIHHVEGAQTLQAPSFVLVNYDVTEGVPVSQASVDQTAYPAKSLTQTMGGFDKAGRPTTITDASNITTTYTYDDRGRVLTVSRPGSPQVTATYSGETRVDVTTNGRTTTTVYDGLGRMAMVVQPSVVAPGGIVLSSTQTPTYDQYGRMVCLTEVNPAGTSRSHLWAYDALDRVISETPPVGGLTTTTYGIAGVNSTVTTTRSNQVSTTILKDPFGQVVEVDAPDGSRTTTTYDGYQIYVSIQPSSGTPQARSFYYDALGRLTSKNEPETNMQTYGGFNALNQPTVVKEAYGTIDARIRTLAFDGFGRLTSMANGSDNLLYTYTGPNLTFASRTVGGQTVSQTFAYNGVGGRLSSETTIQPGLTTDIGYTYDPTGRLTGLSYPSGRAVGYGYDALDRVTSITNNGAALVSNITFDDWGNRYQTIFASTSQDTWVADLTGTRLDTWSIGYVGGGSSKGYQYDNATNILKTAGEWTTLIHDKLGRLTEADGFGIKTAHTYDAFGNAITHTATANGSPVPPAFNNFVFDPLVNNQIPGQEKNQALTGWNTNLRGEATLVGTATSSGTVLGLGWDGLGLVKSVMWNGGNQNFLYAPSGMRVSLTDAVTSANNRKYAYTTQGLLLGEYVNATGTPSWKRDVVYLGSQAIAEIDANGVHELHSDHLGSPRLITKGSGTWASSDNGKVDGTLAYGPYGEALSSTGYVPLTGYTGHVQTDTSGLIYMRGRYYSPAWHAFVNSDQGVDQNSLNQRAYVAGSPFMGTDPSGMILVRTTDGRVLDCDSNGNCVYKGTLNGGGYAPVTGSTAEPGEYSHGSMNMGLDPWYSQPSRIYDGVDGAGSGSSPQSPKPLSKEKCAALKLMLAQEKSYGTTGMGLRQAYMLNIADRAMGNTSRGNSILFASQNNSSPTPTTMGGMDLDWFIHLNGIASTRWIGISVGAVAKQVWNTAYRITGDKNWETPFQGDPGEALAAEAYWGGKKLSDLIPPGLLSQLCPE